MELLRSLTMRGRPSSSPACLRKALVAGTIGLFVVIGFWYSMAVPPFEKPDEVYHYAFARLLAEGNPLPVQTGEIDGPWAQEGSQPPLYYWGVGRLISWVDLSDYDHVSELNPYANIGDPLYPGNKNLMLYSAVQRPLTGTNLAVHLGRWFSLVLGALTLWLVYRIARMAFPGSVLLAWLVLATVAMVPQYAFISSSVSNDSLIILCSTAVVYWLARLLARPDTQPIAWWEWLVLGVLLGLAALSKVQGVGLIVLSGIVVIWLVWRRWERNPESRNAGSVPGSAGWRALLEVVALVLLPAIAIAGWWYVRNYRLYGDWLGLVPLFTINGLRDTPQTWAGFLGEMRGLRYSFWGLFGWFNILLPDSVYRVFDALSLLAVAGVAGALVAGLGRRQLRLASRPELRIMLLLAVWAAMIFGTLLVSSFVVRTSQGRLAFPALGAFAVLLVAGLAFWLRLPMRIAEAAQSGSVRGEAGYDRDRLLPVLALVPLALLLGSVYSLTVILPRSYLPQASVLALPSGAQAVHTRFADHLELAGVRLPKGRFQASQTVPLTLYWKTDAKLPDNYPLFVQLLDENRETIANITSHPGWGRNPTSLWQPDVIYPDSYEVAIPGGVSSRAPLLATLYVGFVDPATGAPVQATDASGAPAEGMVGRIPLIASQNGEPGSASLAPAQVSFDDAIRLVGYAYPGSIEELRQARDQSKPSVVVRLLWEASGQPLEEYTAFVHLVGPDGNFVTGFDRPPADHGFSTTYWEEGDRFLSDFMLALPLGLPSGGYQVWAGLYRSDSQGSVRLPVQDSDLPTQDARVLLGLLEIK
jgi:hypothetical protein